jgi:hypothetical protein
VPLTRFRIGDIFFINPKEARTMENWQKWLPFLEKEIYRKGKQCIQVFICLDLLIYWSDRSLGGTLEEVLDEGEEGD